MLTAENCAALPRYYVTVWTEGNELLSNQIIPQAVADTIRAAVARGMRHGTVRHERTIRGVDGVFPELHCWQLS